MMNRNVQSDWWDDEDETLNPDSFAVHPGSVLKNTVLPARKITGAALADAIAVARPGFNTMLNGKRALTAVLALKIEAAIGYPADLLVSLQAQYDLAAARRTKSFVVKNIAAMADATAAALGRIPVGANENAKVRKAV